MKKIKNTILVENYLYTGIFHQAQKIHLTQYNTKEKHTRKLNSAADIHLNYTTDTVNWIEVEGIGDLHGMERIGEELKLHRMDVQAMLMVQHMAKVEFYDDKILVVINTPYYDEEKNLQLEHLSFILGKNYLISCQERESPLFAEIHNAIEKNISHICDRSVDYLFCLLINNVLINYFEILNEIEEASEEMEDILLSSDADEKLRDTIQQKRREYLSLKKNIISIKEDFSQLTRNEHGLIKKENLDYAHDITDRLTRIIQSLEICRETFSTLLDLYISNNDLRMNSIMKRLTVVTSIFIPLTFFAGVWGMNFKQMPELEWEYGYFAAWVIMVITAIAIWIYIKRRKWY